jgi:helicase
MYEFDVPLEEHIALPQRPELLLSLAVGLLGDAAAAIAAGDTVVAREETTNQALLFAATYFESYIESRLNGEVSTDFSVLGAAAYYLADNPGSAVVVARGMAPPPLALGSGLAMLVYRLILSNYDAIGTTAYGLDPDRVLAALSSYLSGADSTDDALAVIRGVTAWFGLFAPANTPVEIVDKIGSDTRMALTQPDVRRRYMEIGNEVIGSSKTDFASMIQAEAPKWANFIKEIGVKLD